MEITNSSQLLLIIASRIPGEPCGPEVYWSWRERKIYYYIPDGTCFHDDRHFPSMDDVVGPLDSEGFMLSELWSIMKTEDAEKVLGWYIASQM